MSSTTKIVIAAIVVIALALGGYYWYISNPASPAGTGPSDTTALPSGSDTSDASLEQDMNAINANVQAANSDSAAVDQSVNAQASDSAY